MTFLSFGIHKGAIRVAMDTLASIETDETMYLEKSFYMESTKSIISIKGSINILGPFMLEIFKWYNVFNTVQELEKYITENINKHLADRIRKNPRVEGQISDFWIFSWKNDKPAFFRAKYFPFEKEEFVFEKGIINENEELIANTNNISRETSLVLSHNHEIYSAFVEGELKYGIDSYESKLILNSMAAKFNEEPLIGGDLFLYTLSKSAPEFKKDIIYQLSTPTSELVSLRRVTLEANGTLE